MAELKHEKTVCQTEVISIRENEFGDVKESAGSLVRKAGSVETSPETGNAAKEIESDVDVDEDVEETLSPEEEGEAHSKPKKAKRRGPKSGPKKRKGIRKRIANCKAAVPKADPAEVVQSAEKSKPDANDEDAKEEEVESDGSGKVNDQRRKLRKRLTAVSYREDSITVIKPLGRERVECPHCDKEFEKRYLKLHLLKHSGDRPHVCDICKKTFISRYNVKLHKERCHGAKKMFDCDICKRTFSSKHAATEHRRTHTGEKPYQCKTCGREFSHMSAWTSHERTHNPNLNRVFQCQQCSKVFKHKRSLQKHTESVHQGIRKAHAYLCSTCGQSYDSHSKLKVHQYRHTGERPFSCQDCSKTFMTKDVLRNHMLIHADVKPFQCESCGMRFRQAITFKRHRSVHTGIKPFKCKICSKQFIHRVYMMKHECYKSRRGREKKKPAPDGPTAVEEEMRLGPEKPEETA